MSDEKLEPAAWEEKCGFGVVVDWKEPHMKYEPLDRRSDWIEYVRDLLEQIKRDPATFIDGFTPPESVFRDGIDAAANSLLEELSGLDGKTVEGEQ